MKGYIFMRLVIPLSILSLLSLFIHSQRAFDGFFINLATEVIGIVITVAYVDWVLEKRHKNEWEEAGQKIFSRLRVFIDSSLASIRISLGYTYAIFDSVNGSSSDPLQIFEATEHVIKSECRARCTMLSEQDWLTFAEQLRIILDEGDKLLAIFAYSLSPTQYANIMDVRGNIHNMLVLIATLSTINKYEEEESTIMREKIYDYIAQRITAVIDSLKALSSTKQ